MRNRSEAGLLRRRLAVLFACLLLTCRPLLLWLLRAYLPRDRQFLRLRQRLWLDRPRNVGAENSNARRRRRRRGPSRPGCLCAVAGRRGLATTGQGGGTGARRIEHTRRRFEDPPTRARTSGLIGREYREAVFPSTERHASAVQVDANALRYEGAQEQPGWQGNVDQQLASGAFVAA